MKFLVEDIQLLIDAGHGPYLASLNTKMVVDCYEFRDECDFLMVNSVRNAYICDDDLTGREFDEVQANWRPAVKNVDLKQGTSGGSPYYSVFVKQVAGGVELFATYGSGAHLAIPIKRSSNREADKNDHGKTSTDGPSSQARLSLVTRSSSSNLGKRGSNEGQNRKDHEGNKRGRISDTSKGHTNTAAISRVNLQATTRETRSLRERRGELAKASYQFTSIEDLAPASRSTREMFQQFTRNKFPGTQAGDDITEDFSVEEASVLVTEFVKELVHSGLSTSMINRVIDVLKMLHQVSGGERSDIIFNRERKSMLSTTMSSTTTDASRSRSVVQQSITNSFLPIPDCMVEAQIKQFDMCSWDKNMLRKGATAVYLLCYNFGGRISNYVVGDKRKTIAGTVVKNTHFIRCVDAHFTIRPLPLDNSERTIIQVVADCKAIRSALGISFDPFHKWAEKSDVEKVESIDLRFITSKSTKAWKDKGRSSGGKLRSLNRSTVGEGRHIEVLALWVANCGSNSDLDENTPLFSFHAPSGATTSSRNIRSKEVKAELRQNAIQEGLDPKWF
jgi:hypothetical protein